MQLVPYISRDEKEVKQDSKSKVKSPLRKILRCFENRKELEGGSSLAFGSR
jgi:hypothetical protein